MRQAEASMAMTDSDKGYLNNLVTTEVNIKT